MKNKITISILIGIIFLAVTGYFLLQFFREQSAFDSANTVKIKKIIEKKNIGSTLVDSEQRTLDDYVKKNIDKKTMNIEEKQVGETVRYTQDELDFIADPEYATERDLGIHTQKKVPVVYTKEELHYIADPDSFSIADQERLRKQIERKE